MLAMFAGFAVYFFYDYKVGYPEKNLVYYHYRAFHDAGQAWKKEENRANWEDFAGAQKMVAQGKDKSGAEFDEQVGLPAGTEIGGPWPEVLSDAEAMENKGYKDLCSEYAGKRPGWPEHVNLTEDYFSQKKVREQMWFGILCSVLALIALVVYLRTRGRFMKVDEEAFYATGGRRIPYGEIKKIDKRKWETKGLATLYYEADGTRHKTKVDGMVYGQFKEEEGASAEALFKKLMAHFSGELVEVLEDDGEGEKVEKEPKSGEAGGKD